MEINPITMRYFTFLLCLIIWNFSCTNSSSETTTATKKSTKNIVKKTEKEITNSAKELAKRKNCPIEGVFKKENLKQLQKSNQLLVILANESTKDSKLGESHRVLKVIDQTNCKEVFKETLPINRSPDFPYNIADINYNNTNALVAIKGYDQIYCYDITNERLTPALKPKFVNQREAQDAQSGQIQHLELWEDYIIGYAIDYGTFVFKVGENNVISPELPYSEYKVEGTDDFKTLFALASTNAATQLLFPDYDFNTNQFSLNPILEKPTELELSKSVISKNNRFAILVEKATKQLIAIDVKNKKRVALGEAQGQRSPIQVMKELLKEE